MCNRGLLCSIGEAINECIKDLNWIHAKVLNRNCLKDRCADKISLIPADSNFDPKNDVIAGLFRKEKQFRIIT